MEQWLTAYKALSQFIWFDLQAASLILPTSTIFPFTGPCFTNEEIEGQIVHSSTQQILVDDLLVLGTPLGPEASILSTKKPSPAFRELQSTRGGGEQVITKSYM